MSSKINDKVVLQFLEFETGVSTFLSYELGEGLDNRDMLAKVTKLLEFQLQNASIDFLKLPTLFKSESLSRQLWRSNNQRNKIGYIVGAASESETF